LQDNLFLILLIIIKHLRSYKRCSHSLCPFLLITLRNVELDFLNFILLYLRGKSYIPSSNSLLLFTFLHIILRNSNLDLFSPVFVILLVIWSWRFKLFLVIFLLPLINFLRIYIRCLHSLRNLLSIILLSLKVDLSLSLLWILIDLVLFRPFICINIW
jgi:hypothetical protein